MEFEFENYDTGKNIKFKTDKSFILIYGKNGSGKTTLSRNNIFDKQFVFNEDFIYSNVYNISEEGAQQTAKTKENFSGLWLGDDIVKVRVEITKLISLEKQLKEEYQKEVDTLNKYFSQHQILIDLNSKIKLLSDKDFELDIERYEEQKNQYKSNYSFETSIENHDKFLEKLNFLKKNDIYNMLISKIKLSSLLSNIILKDNNSYLNELNFKIAELGKQQKLILEIEEVYKKENITMPIIEKIKEWYILHEKRNECLFCGNSNITTALEKWKKVFSNEFIKEKNDILAKLKKDIEYAERIIQEKAFYEVDKDTIECTQKIINQLNLKYDEISKNLYNELEFDFNLPKKEILERSTLIEDLSNYGLEQKKNIFGFYYNALIKISLIKKAKTDYLDRLMDEKGTIIANKINNKFKEFGLNKNIVISVDKYSTPHKFTYSLKNHSSVKELSDGQKHKLALAIFMNYLEEQDLKDKIIVIDDPVVSLDISSYILFKQYIISNLITNKFDVSTKLIILTHDISYLYIQASNIFENNHMKSITELYKLSDTKTEKIPLDFIKTDDITLFRDLLDNLKTLDELYVLNSIVNKIFRILIDLRLRMYGKSLTEGIGIDELPYSTDKIDFLNVVKKQIVQTSRRNHPSDEEIIRSFKLLKESAELLGFSDFITDSHIENIEKIVKEQIKNGIFYELFNVIISVKNFLKLSDNDNMKNYVDHTRNSYTRNIIGLSLDDYFENE